MMNCDMTLFMKLHDLVAFNEVPNIYLLRRELSIYMENAAISDEVKINILRNKDFVTGSRYHEKLTRARLLDDSLESIEKYFIKS